MICFFEMEGVGCWQDVAGDLGVAGRPSAAGVRTRKVSLEQRASSVRRTNSKHVFGLEMGWVHSYFSRLGLTHVVFG